MTELTARDKAFIDKVLQEDRRMVEAVAAGIRATATKPDALLYVGDGWYTSTIAGLFVYYTKAIKCMHWGSQAHDCPFILMWYAPKDTHHADRKRFAEAYGEIMGGEGE